MEHLAGTCLPQQASILSSCTRWRKLGMIQWVQVVVWVQLVLVTWYLLLRYLFVHDSNTKHFEGTFACVCGKRYASLTALKNHAKLHTIRERNFICEICKKVRSFFKFLMLKGVPEETRFKETWDHASRGLSPVLLWELWDYFYAEWCDEQTCQG